MYWDAWVGKQFLFISGARLVVRVKHFGDTSWNRHKILFDKVHIINLYGELYITMIIVFFLKKSQIVVQHSSWMKLKVRFFELFCTSLFVLLSYFSFGHCIVVLLRFRVSDYPYVRFLLSYTHIRYHIFMWGY
jgi:hypothetical protein